MLNVKECFPTTLLAGMAFWWVPSGQASVLKWSSDWIGTSIHIWVITSKWFKSMLLFYAVCSCCSGDIWPCELLCIYHIEAIVSPFLSPHLFSIFFKVLIGLVQFFVQSPILIGENENQPWHSCINQAACFSGFCLLFLFVALHWLGNHVVAWMRSIKAVGEGEYKKEDWQRFFLGTLSLLF